MAILDLSGNPIVGPFRPLENGTIGFSLPNEQTWTDVFEEMLYDFVGASRRYKRGYAVWMTASKNVHVLVTPDPTYEPHRSIQEKTDLSLASFPLENAFLMTGGTNREPFDAVGFLGLPYQYHLYVCRPNGVGGDVIIRASLLL